MRTRRMLELSTPWLFVLAAAALPLMPAGAAEPATGKTSSAATVALDADVSWLRGEFDRHGRPNGNSLLIRTDDGLIVFDSGRHAAYAHSLVDAARAQALPITTIVNSHWHLDHVSGNPILRAAFPKAQVYASAEIHHARAQEFLAHGRARMQEANASEADAEAKHERELEIERSSATATTPIDHVVSKTSDVTIGGRKLVIGLSAFAATGGDVWMFDRASGVLASGDLVTLPAPFLDTACPATFRSALKTIDALPFKRLVPGHGNPMRKRDFKRYQRAVDALFACAATTAEATACATAWRDDASSLMTDSERENAVPYAEYYVSERLRADPATLASDCGR